jgi:hypothetical protein
MPRPRDDEDTQWSRNLELRVAALESIFGKQGMYLAAFPPFEHGGGTTILEFPHFDSSLSIFCTCELTACAKPGQLPSGRGPFEVVIAVPKGDPLGPKRKQGVRAVEKGWVGVILDAIARMSFEASFDHGHTIGPWDELKPMTHAILLEDAPPANLAFGGRKYGMLTVFLLRPEEFEFGEKNKEGLIRMIRSLGPIPASSLDRPSLLYP